MSGDRIVGIEAAQLRALVQGLAAADDQAVIGLGWTDTALMVRVDHPDRRRSWLTITFDAEVLPTVGPAPGPRLGQVDQDGARR